MHLSATESVDNDSHPLIKGAIHRNLFSLCEKELKQ